MPIPVLTCIISVVTTIMVIWATTQVDRKFKVGSKKWLLCNLGLVLLFLAFAMYVRWMNPRLYYGK